MTSDTDSEGWYYHPLVIGVLGGALLLAIKQFYIVNHLGYPAGPSQVDTQKEMAQYCSYSTACDIGVAVPAMLVGALALILLVVHRVRG